MMLKFFFCILLLAEFALDLLGLEEQSNQPWLVHIPQNWRYNPPPQPLPIAPSNISFIHRCDFIRRLNPKLYKAVDFEILTALEVFFWNLGEGISLELGALDGSPTNWIAPSQTGELESLHSGWRRILVEANPFYREDMKIKSSNAFSANAAICHRSSSHSNRENFNSDSKSNIVHYIVDNSGPIAATGGIIEYFAPNFIKTFYSYLLTGPEGSLASNLTAVVLPPGVTISEVPCLPLQRILDRALSLQRHSNNLRNGHKVSRNDSHPIHINFFVLDVEGAEMEVLYSIAWHRTTFDVLCIENEPDNRPKGFKQLLISFLEARGYEFIKDKKRNSWFKRKGFIPSTRPNCCPIPPVNRQGEWDS